MSRRLKPVCLGGPSEGYIPIRFYVFGSLSDYTPVSRPYTFGLNHRFKRSSVVYENFCLTLMFEV